VLVENYKFIDRRYQVLNIVLSTGTYATHDNYHNSQLN